MPVKKEVEEKGKGMIWVASQEPLLGPLSSGFSLLQAGILGDISGEGFSRIFICILQMRLFRAMVSTDW